MIVPILMAVLSLTLPAATAHGSNVVVATLFVGVSVANAIDDVALPLGRRRRRSRAAAARRPVGVDVAAPTGAGERSGGRVSDTGSPRRRPPALLVPLTLGRNSLPTTKSRVGYSHHRTCDASASVASDGNGGMMGWTCRAPSSPPSTLIESDDAQPCQHERRSDDPSPRERDDEEAERDPCVHRPSSRTHRLRHAISSSSRSHGGCRHGQGTGRFRMAGAFGRRAGATASPVDLAARLSCPRHQPIGRSGIDSWRTFTC